MTALRLAAAAIVVPVSLMIGESGCKRSGRQPVLTAAPMLPAGFVEQTGQGWRVAVPSTWTSPSTGLQGVWQAIDPQPVDDYRANASVVAEAFPGDSQGYANANEATLRRDHRASVQVTREDTIDGDTTLITESLWTPHPPATALLRTMQAHLAARGTGYVVTCTVSASAFERYRSTCESVVRSFAVER